MATVEIELRELGPAPAAAAATVILLHGFGAPGDDLVALADAVDAPAALRYVFPAAPLELPGLYGDSRAWWMLDLARIERMATGGAAADDRSDEVPDGLAPARELVDALVGEAVAAGARKVVLGGFSQGAMLALDVALHSAHPIAGLALMSGTRINATAWRARLDRVRGVPVMMSHGKADQLLPFATSVSLRDELRGAGAEVDWIEFPGGHEIPPVVLTALGSLLARVATR
jgi:phospholipase/carboxylesterase